MDSVPSQAAKILPAVAQLEKKKGCLLCFIQHFQTFVAERAYLVCCIDEIRRFTAPLIAQLLFLIFEFNFQFFKNKCKEE